jgi:hypothetical protein
LASCCASCAACASHLAASPQRNGSPAAQPFLANARYCMVELLAWPAQPASVVSAMMAAITLPLLMSVSNATEAGVQPQIPDHCGGFQTGVGAPQAALGCCDLGASLRRRPRGFLLLSLRRWLDILLPSPCATEPVGAFRVRRIRFLVRPRVLLVVRVTYGFFRVRLLHPFAPSISGNWNAPWRLQLSRRGCLFGNSRFGVR